MDPGALPPSTTSKPPIINYVLSFLLVGVAWGFTTPFIRRAAADFQARQDARKQGISGEGRTGEGQTRREGHRVDEGTDDGGDDQGEGEETELLSQHQDSSNDSDPDEDHTDANATGYEDNTAHLRPQPHPNPPPRPAWMTPSSSQSIPNILITKAKHLIHTIINLLLTPAYSIPLFINLTGSIWFFLLVGQHELSLTVPLANSSAFLFTVLGEWYVERKVIAKETWLGMAMVLGGIAVCVMGRESGST